MQIIGSLTRFVNFKMLNLQSDVGCFMPNMDQRSTRKCSFVCALLILASGLLGASSASADDFNGLSYTLNSPTEETFANYQQNVASVVETCVGCHSNAIGNLGALASNADQANYGVLAKYIADGFGDILLSKTAGQSHGGGLRFESSSDQYQTLVNFIELESAINVSATVLGRSSDSNNTAIVIPDNVTLLDGVSYPVTSISPRAFIDSPITSVTIGDNVQSIGSEAFSKTRLTSVVIGNSVTTIGDLAFYLVQTGFGISSVTIPNSVTSIGLSAFCGQELSSVIIPDSVTNIGLSAFCNISSVSFLGDYSTGFNDGAFSGNSDRTIEACKDSETWLNKSFEGVAVSYCRSVFINRIAQAAANNDASTITLATLIGAGVTGAVEENLEAYRTAIAASATGSLTELTQIQTLVEESNTNSSNTNNMDAGLLACIKASAEGVPTEAVTSLVCSGPGITSLTGIEQFLNLTSLNLKDNQISDFSPLTGLVKLQTLNLENTNLSNVSALRDMVNMTNLVLRGNSLSDIYPLEDLVNITHLDLRLNSIKNIAPLRNMLAMKELRLSGNPLNSLLPLGSMSLVELITISSGEFPSTDFLSIAPGLSSLNHVILRDNDITSIAGLELLTNLRELKLRGNNIVNLGPLLKDERLENIILIELTDNVVDDEQLQELKRKYPGIVTENGSNTTLAYDGHLGSDIEGSEHKCATDKYTPVIEVINKSGTRPVNDSLARYKCANVGITITKVGNGFTVKGFYDDSNNRSASTIELKDIVFYLGDISTQSVFTYSGDTTASLTVDETKGLLTLTFAEPTPFSKDGVLTGEHTLFLASEDGTITPTIASFTTRIKTTEYTNKPDITNLR